VATAALGAYLHLRPGLNAVDRLGFALPQATTHSWRFFRTVTWFGTVPALVLGSLGAAMVAWFTGRRDRWRALACLLGPPIAAALDQFVLKPLVDRRYLGDYSFASGSVTVLAGVSTAWVLAVTRRTRPAAAVFGSLGVALMIGAVVALRWHYPSDALAGVGLGVGVVLTVDGAAHILAGRRAGGNAPGGPHAAGHSTNGSGAHRTTRETVRSLLIENEGGAMHSGADEPESSRIAYSSDAFDERRARFGPNNRLGRRVVVVIIAVRSLGSVRFQVPAGNVRRALYFLTARWSDQASAERLGLQPASAAARASGRR
jgi:membrane-associated phospholipid phosphatase